MSQTLRDYGIEITDITAITGPTVTLYKIKPAAGVRISKIKNLEDDIALSLAALGIRIIAPIPGESNVGIEVPNAKPQIVAMKTMLESEAFQKAQGEDGAAHSLRQDHQQRVLRHRPGQDAPPAHGRCHGHG